MGQKTFTYPREFSLDELSQAIAADEAGVGKLVALNRPFEGSVATFQSGDGYPDKPVRLTPAAGGVPKGHAKVCEGQVWAGGQAETVIAVRPD